MAKGKQTSTPQPLSDEDNEQEPPKRGKRITRSQKHGGINWSNGMATSKNLAFLSPYQLFNTDDEPQETPMETDETGSHQPPRRGMMGSSPFSGVS
jgi:hypothetical protein